MVSAAIRHFFVILTLVHFITCSVKVLRNLKWCKISETYCLFSRLTQNRRLKKKRRYLTHLFTAMVFISLSFPPEWLLGRLAAEWSFLQDEGRNTETLPQTRPACSTCFLSPRLRSYWLSSFCLPYTCCSFIVFFFPTLHPFFVPCLLILSPLFA